MKSISKEMENKLYKASLKKGISLITLVITIIVIIILAGAVILTLSQNNPIQSANQAVFKSNVSGYNDELSLWMTSKYASNGGNFDAEGVNANNSDIKYQGLNIQDIIKSMSDTEASKFAIEDGRLIYVATSNETEKKWAEDILGITTVATPYAKAKPAVAEESVGTVLEENSTIDGQNPNYANPVIPAGFFAVNTTATSWNNAATDYNNGLVIQDTYGNQFVWVPIYSEVPHAKWCTTGGSYLDTTEATITGFITPTYGFYIGRYESSSNGTKAASKKGASVWVNKSWMDAKTVSENMAVDYGYTTVGSNLINGTEWDTVMRWIENESATTGKSVTNGANWGNYSNSSSPADVSGCGTLQVSGFSDKWRAKNIYDLAGNTYEWVGENFAGGFVMHDGQYSSDGTSTPPARRTFISTPNGRAGTSFRVALYLK